MHTSLTVGSPAWLSLDPWVAALAAASVKSLVVLGAAALAVLVWTLALLDKARSRRAVTRWTVLGALLLLGGVVVPVAMLRATAARPEETHAENAAAGREPAGAALRGAATSRTNEPFVVFGRVTNERGQPLAGVEVRAACGIGTLLPTGTTNTAPDGSYRLVFRPGMLVGQLLGSGSYGAGFQAATISARKAGYCERNLGRQGNLAMTDRPESEERTNSFAGVVRADQPYELNFVMTPAASVRGVLVDERGQPVARQDLWISGPELPPSSSVLASARTSADGRFQFREVPVGRKWFFVARGREPRQEITSESLEFGQPATYEVKLVRHAEKIEVAASTRRPLLLDQRYKDPEKPSADATASNPGAILVTFQEPVTDVAASELARELAPTNSAQDAPVAARSTIPPRLAARVAGRQNTGHDKVILRTHFLLDWEALVGEGGDSDQAQRPWIYRYPGLDFAEAGGVLSATVRLRYASWPHSGQAVRLEILDRSGQVLTNALAAWENSGTIERIPSIEERTITLRLGSAVRQEGATFRCGLETLWTEQGNPFKFGEQVPLSLDLGTAEYSKVFRAQWLKIEPEATNAQATVHARLVSWPKCRWRVTLKLSDSQGRTVGLGSGTVENSGTILKYPSVSEKDLRFAVTNAGSAWESARRYTLRLERLRAP